MLVTIQKQVTTVEPVTIEVQLPIYTKHRAHYYAIDEEETLVQLYLGSDHCSLTTYLKGSPCMPDQFITEAVTGKPITETEFLRAISQLIPASKELIDL